MSDALNNIERHLLAESEIRQLGHRILYDTKTGWSKNIFGCHVDPRCLDANGYQVKFDPQ